jgi:predicted ATPase
MRGGGQVLRFTHLLVKNWRNFLKADVELRRRVILAGPSGAGKSNLVDVFSFVRDLAAPGAGFQEAVRRRGGVRRLRCLAARQDSDLALLVRAGGEENPAEWEYELHFNQEGQPRPVIKREQLSRCGEDLFVRPDASDEADPERLTQTFLEQGSLRKELRTFAEFLGTVRYIHLVPQLMREPDRSAGGGHDSFGRDILERIAATPEKSQNARLRWILEALQAAVPRLIQLEARRDAHGRPHLRALYEHWRPRGAWQTEEQFSDGTLRLIGLLWAVLEGSGPLLIEEPEISLHPEIVRLIPQMLARLARRSGRQTILTTHSLDLLCGEGVGSEEILILNPREEGTSIRPAFELGEAADLLDRGALPAEAPASGEEAGAGRQMALFGEQPE